MTITTKAHAYLYDVRKPDEAQGYAALCERLKTQGLKMFHSLGEHYALGAKLKGHSVTLETKHLFDNQWNTGPIAGLSEQGYRVFDWAEDAIFNNGRENTWCKRGYWLDQIPEMYALRANTNACGYCGHQEPALNGSTFCTKCVDSEYLKPEELHLLRMMPITNGLKPRGKLTTEERDQLLPIFQNAQVHGNTVRNEAKIAKRRKRIENEYQDDMQKAQTAVRNAQIKHDGFIWLMDHGLNVENVIFYSHTGVFEFGWHGDGISKEVESVILDAITEFPYTYEIKCADGRKLRGER